MGWMDDYQSHTVWSELDVTTAHIHEVLEAGEIDGGDPRVEMLRALLGRVDGMRECPDITITRSALDEASELLVTLRSELPDLDVVFSPNYTVMTFDALARLIGSWPQPGSARLTGLGAQIALIDSAAGAAEQRISGLGEKLATADSAINDRIVAQAAAADDLVANVAARVAEVDRTVTNLTATAETQKGRIDTAIAAFQTEFTAHETERETAWAAHLAAQQVKVDGHMERMEAYEAKSVKVLEAVGVNSTATDFGLYAKDQKKAADRWRFVAAAVFVAAGAWFIASSFPWFTTDGTDAWESALARLGVTAAVAGVGAYAARESSQHRREERRAKQVQLVLTALEPFIANLPEEEQNKVRKASADAIFILRPEATSNEKATGDSILELLNSLATRTSERS